MREASSADKVAIANALPLLREQPDRTLATKRLAGRKVNKERISIALCANADGSHKLKPLIIGKFEKPRYFKNIKIQFMPMTYHNNAKAWMITSLFQEWIWEFDHQVGLKHQGQRVLLLLDNCSSHKLDGLTLRYTDVYFLPPNTTSKIQPMDAGVIMSFKRHYRRSHVRLLLRYVEVDNRAEDLRMDILQAIRFIIQAWDLRNVSEDICQNENLVLNELTDALRDLNLPYPMQAEEFLNLPEDNIVYKVPEDDKIIEEYLFKNTDKENMDLEEIDDSDEIPVISTSTAIASLETVRMFLLQQENAEEYVKLVGKIEKFFRVKKTNSLRQTDINAYFH
ncbi:22161_t:CDS:2 [Rhizophagus irregularis]|nr:22161_t:CDS:2 [Rhizophagus irregularis]